MPVPMLRDMAKQAGVSLETAEEHWEKAKEIVHTQYPDVKVGSKKYWELVVGVTKKSLKLGKKRFSKEALSKW